MLGGSRIPSPSLAKVMTMLTGARALGQSVSVAETRWRRDRRFFTVMAAVAALTIFIGFAPTYYLKGAYGAPALPPLVHLHGAVFTAWIVLLAVQTSLIAIRRTDLHRRFGIAGAVLAGLMTLMAPVVATGAVRRGAIPVSFLWVPLSSVVVFPVLVGAALIVRRNPEAHKRLMLIATAELLTVGVGRWPGVRNWGPFWTYGLTDVFLAALIIYDVMTRRRVHPATFWGGLFFVASQPLRVTIGRMDTWLVFARWLTS